MPLAFTQEDFLVAEIILLFPGSVLLTTLPTSRILRKPKVRFVPSAVQLRPAPQT